MSLFATGTYSQNARVSLNLKNVSVKDALKAIERSSEFFFIYNNELIDVERKVDIEAKDQKISDILNTLFAGETVAVSVIDKKIILAPDSPPTQQAAKSVAGKVSDTDGNPLPGVTVVVVGTTNGIITDAAGRFTLTGIPENAALRFSFVGMKTQEIAVGKKTVINVVLEEETIGLKEIVAVGYGTQRRSEITGAVASVKTEQLIAQPTADLQSMLKGKVPGLYVTTNDARPGGSSDVLLRGIRSLKGGNAPLYVVDGVPLSSINEINIDDIETMSVLKDATSQAIYGSRASNGVILISTKRGKNSSNKVNITYHGYVSIQNVTPNFEIFSPEEYMQVRREAYRGDLATAANGWIGTYPKDEQMFTPLELQSMANKTYVNWTDYAFNKNAPLTKHDLSLSGGNENTKYSASLGYFNQDGIRYSSGLKRYSGKLTLDQTISKTFKTGLSVYYTNYTQQQETNSWIDFITFSPISKIYDDNGELVRYPTGDGKSVNPLYYQKTRQYDYKAERLVLNGYFEITPTFLPGFKYKLNLSLNSRNREADTFRNFQDPSNLTQGYGSVNFYKNSDYLLENILTYNKLFGTNHKLDITAMQGVEPRHITSTTATALQLGNDFFGINSLGSALQSQVNRDQTDRNMISFMGRVNYTLKEKYVLNLTVRADGSSVFGAKNKWGYFPSVAMAWNLSKESFVKKIDWLSEAKLRISYGQIGNQGIDPYGSLATADNAFYVSGATPVVGYLPGTSLPNPALKWETTTTANIGLDFSMFKGRLSGSAEVYKSNTTDLLVDRKLPTVLGYSVIPANLGEIENKGLEVSLTGHLISKKDFSWSVGTNFSLNRNKLLKGVLQDPATGAFIDDKTNNWFIGKSVNVYYDYQFAGIWQLTDDIAHSAQPLARPGDVRVTDVSGPDGKPDGKITADDRVVIDRNPKWIGSLSTSFSWKDLELSAELYTVQGVTKENVFLSDFNHGGRLDGILNGIKREYWTPENPSTITFRPHATSYSDYRGTLSYQDASYFRLRNVTLSYKLPTKWTRKAGMSSVKVYVTGDNLWTSTEFKSYSPELAPDQYPETRNYTFGININF